MAGHYSPPPTEFEKELWEQHAQRAAQASTETKRPPTPRPAPQTQEALTRMIEETWQRMQHSDEGNQLKEYAERMQQVMTMTVDQAKKNAQREFELLKAKHETELVKQQMEMLKAQHQHELEMAKAQQELKELRARVDSSVRVPSVRVHHVQKPTIESPMPAVDLHIAVNKLSGELVKFATHVEMNRQCNEWKAKVNAGEMTEAEENALGLEMLQKFQMLPEAVNTGACCISSLSWAHLRTLVSMSTKGKVPPLVVADDDDNVLCRDHEGDSVFALRISASTKDIYVFADE